MAFRVKDIILLLGERNIYSQFIILGQLELGTIYLTGDIRLPTFWGQSTVIFFMI